MNLDTRNCLLLIVLGVVLIGAGEAVYAPEHLDIRQIDDSTLGQHVQITGTVTQLERAGDVTFISMGKRPSLDIVTFTPVHDVHVNQTARIIGRVTLYHGRLEVIADRIRPE